MPVEKKDSDKKINQKIFREFLIYAIIILIAVASAALIRTFILEPFIVPTPSMEPTLKVGDRVIINKLAYKFGPVKRGDIIAFYSPVEKKCLTKRVIAIEGDKITLTGDGEIFINGEKLIENYLPTDQNISYPEQTVIVGENEVFVMGDNRNNSFDSRFFGTISEDDIFGKFLLIYWPPSRWRF
ncbi:MAG: signal peptidase I [Actinomycetota bacterium]|jgi:signal peptidase I|nr:signal peptidase I [Actinomycetota bacterium]MDD5600681.1 signal peptidase I [Actinomycetota bacterium]